MEPQGDIDLSKVTQGTLYPPGLCTAASGLVLDLRVARNR